MLQLTPIWFAKHARNWARCALCLVPAGFLAVQPGTRAWWVSLPYSFFTWRETKGKRNYNNLSVMKQSHKKTCKFTTSRCRHNVGKISYAEPNTFYHRRDTIQIFTVDQLQCRVQDNEEFFIITILKWNTEQGHTTALLLSDLPLHLL